MSAKNDREVLFRLPLAISTGTLAAEILPDYVGRISTLGLSEE
jgi:hypothetical protein